MKKTLQLSLFSLRLIFTIILLVIQIGWYKIPYSARLFSVFSLSTICMTLFILSFLPVQSVTQVKNTYLPVATDKFLIQTVSVAELHEKKAYYEELYRQQPDHIDILINLALINKSLENESEYMLYWNKAREIDPNNVVFSS